MKTGLKFLKAGILLIAVILLFQILKNGFSSENFKNLIIRANYYDLFFCIVLTAIGVFLKGKRLQILAGQFAITNKFIEFTKIQIISIFFAIITPGRAGEFTKIYLLAKDKKENIGAGTVICIFERLLDFLILTLMSLMLCIMILKDTKITVLLIFAALSLGLILFLLFRIELLMDRMAHLLPEKAKNFLNYFIEHKGKLLEKLVEIAIYTVVIWCFDGMVQWTILKSIGSENPFMIVIGINAIVSIMSILTVLPLGLGTMDFSAVFLYSMILNISKEKIVFLLAGARLFGLSTLLLMFLPLFLFQKDLVAKLYTDLSKNRSALAENNSP